MKFKKIDVKQSDVLQSLKDVGIEIEPASTQNGVCIVDLNGESCLLPRNFSIFDDLQMIVKYDLTNVFGFNNVNYFGNNITFQTIATKSFIPMENNLSSPAA